MSKISSLYKASVDLQAGVQRRMVLVVNCFVFLNYYLYLLCCCYECHSTCFRGYTWPLLTV